MKVDYIAIMQGYHGSRNDGFLTDVPISTKLAEDDIVQVRYVRKPHQRQRLMDAKTMRWIANHKTLRRWCTQTIKDCLVGLTELSELVSNQQKDCLSNSRGID